MLFGGGTLPNNGRNGPCGRLKRKTIMDINSIACVGAGLIGSGWATLFSLKGYPVFLQDISEEILDKAVHDIQTNLVFLEENNLLKPGELEDALIRIECMTSIGDAVSNADYIQECVPDDLALKHQVVGMIDAAAKPNAIIASSSSGLMVKEIQKGAEHPERCVMVHPFLPVHLMPLVEIGAGPDTRQETLTSAVKLMEKLGKTPVVLKKEVPGYIVNRLQAAILREAMDLVDSGVATAADIDTAFCKGCGLRDPFIGPFLRAHLAGNGIENFFKRYDQSYRERLSSLGMWTAFPPAAKTTVIKEVNNMCSKAEWSIDALKAERDAKLVQLLEITENESNQC